LDLPPIGGGGEPFTIIPPGRYQIAFHRRIEPTVRAVIADRHPLFRGILRQILGQSLAADEIAEAGTLGQMQALAGSADLILLDLALPGAEGFAGLLHASVLRPAAILVALTDGDDAQLARRARIYGAGAVLSKSFPRDRIAAELRAAVSAPAARDSAPGERVDALTGRERMVLAAMIEGESNKHIAFTLGITETTVKVHVSSILRKLRVDSRVQAVIVTRGRCRGDE